MQSAKPGRRPGRSILSVYVRTRTRPGDKAMRKKRPPPPSPPPKTVQFRALSCTPLLKGLQEKGIQKTGAETVGEKCVQKRIKGAKTQ
jgi:hypothetical protein